MGSRCNRLRIVSNGRLWFLSGIEPSGSVAEEIQSSPDFTSRSEF
jgi:hypothetical protein